MRKANRTRTPARSTRALCSATLAALALTGCTGTTDPDPDDARFRTIPCPGEVDAFLVQPHSCGTLEVPENRSDPRSGRVSLFVVRVQPPSGDGPRAAPMFVAGTDLAVESDYSGFAPMAQRIGREVIMMDHRGTGLSEPSLACPEVRELEPGLVQVPTSAAETRADYLDAVRACAERLSAQGVHLGSYGLADTAQDAVDLRKALGLESWAVTTHGSYSRVALEMVQTDGDAIELLVLDSPEVRQEDPFATAVSATREGLRRAATWCAQDRRCSQTVPDLEGAVHAALQRLRSDPVRLENSDGRAVLMDDVLLLRTLRAMLAGDTLHPEQIAPMIRQANTGTMSELDRAVVEQLASDMAYCLGYLPRCVRHRPINEAVLLTVLCGDLVGELDRAALHLAAGSPTYRDAFVRSPYLDACDVWPVRPEARASSRATSADVPTLALVAGFDPFVSERATHEALEELSPSWLRVFDGPAGTHNLLGNECPRRVRNAWVRRPTSEPMSSAVCGRPGASG